ncbi:MAG TPA: allophanate hydrolase, partial [Phycisphaerae bacterium]
MKIAVVGAHLSGQPLNIQLIERNGHLVRLAKTAPVYRLYALANTTPHKPGLIRTNEPVASGIEVEVWELAPAEFAAFVELVPPPLCIGTLELSDGEKVKGFLVESYAIQPGAAAQDITSTGGWRNYLQSRLDHGK